VGSTFECRMDKSEPRDCPPATFRVKRGSHTFKVLATDPAGNIGPKKSFSFKVVKKH
jgi:hypothetical protein